MNIPLSTFKSERISITGTKTIGLESLLDICPVIIGSITSNCPTTVPTTKLFILSISSVLSSPNTLPFTSPTKLPVTFPVTSPITFPVRLPSTSPVTLPVRSPITFPVNVP